MTSHKHLPSRLQERSTVRTFTAIFFFLSVCVLSTITAAAQCQMGFRPGSSISTIDGNQGTKWNDASILSSGDPCMNFLPDWSQITADTVVTGMVSHAVPFPIKPVKVYTKRDNANFYMAFDIEDQTRDRRDLGNVGMLLGPGERIIIQFDPDNAKSGNLVNDYRIDVSHRWQNTGGAISLVTKNLFDSSGAPNTACLTESFANPTSPAALEVAARVTGLSYFIEFKIPLSLIGNPTGDVGVAFAVINDLGFGDPNCGACDATGISFPTALPIVNVANPIFDNCGWVVPSGWGLGFFNTGLADVTISTMPVYWSSQAVNVFACGVANYIYYPDKPCKATVEATLDNASGVAQLRNILYLWAEDGANPTAWRVIDLKENVSVLPGTGPPIPSAELTSQLIKNKPNHPCVRVYILPASFRADFDRNMILGITTQGQLSTMEMKYGLVGGHSAQKNITRHTTDLVCPNTSCQITRRLDVATPVPAAVQARQENPLPERENTIASGAVPRMLFAGYAQPEMPPRAVARPAPAGAPAQDNQGPLVATNGQVIFLSANDAAQFREANVVVQVRAFGFSQRPSGSKYNFIEELGGVLHVFPIEMLRKLRKVPFELNVGNPGTVHRTIFLSIATYVPPGVNGVGVDIDTGPRQFVPEETKVSRGTVRINQGSVGGFKRWGLSLHAGASIPHGNFSNVFNPGHNAGVDLEYRITPTFSLEGIYTFHRFLGQTFDTVSVGDVNLNQFSVNGKVYGSSSPVRPFVNFGGGAYKFESSPKRAGLNVGGGLQFDVTSTIAVDAMYNFHNVFTSGSNTRFSTVQGGVRFRF